jgi:penicillin-binding protein 1B
MSINTESWAKAVRLTFVCFCVLTTVVAVAYAFALFYLYSFNQDPKLWANAISFYAQPKQALGSLVVRGNDGNPMYATRYELRLDDIKPSALHDCLLAAEDKRFYRHTGMDYFSAAAALLKHFIVGERLRGASTISNQLVGEVILADRSRNGLRAYLRKFEEIILTNVVERHFSKDDLMVAYVNNIPVGHLDGRSLIGLGSASEALFGKKDPKALTLSESCTLAGMLNRPNRYIAKALKGHYLGLANRRNIVLDNLRAANPERYSPEAIARAKNDPIRFSKPANKLVLTPRQFISYAYERLPLRKSGLQVYLTLNPDLQRAAEAAVSKELESFDGGRYGYYNGLSYEHAVRAGRSISKEDAKLQAALVAIDPKTGEIFAMVGGRNPNGDFNRATQAKRAPGSAIKSFIYLDAIDSGSLGGRPFGPETIIDPVSSPAAQRYTTAGPASAIVQLARSDNGAAVALASELGISRVRNFIAKVTGANPVETEQIAIGAGKGIEISPLQLAAAYTIFPNNGLKVAPNPIRAIGDGASTNISEARIVRLIKPGAPLVVARMLQTVVGDGPDGPYGTARIGRRISGLDHRIRLAGKTGTGDNDLWFVGFTSQLVVVVWVGFDDNYPKFEMSKGFEGAGLPLRIWGKFMREAKKYQPDLAVEFK